MNLLDKHHNIYVDTLDQPVNMHPVEGGEILIHIPIETLFYAENHREYNPFEIKVKNKKAMVDYVVEWLAEWGGNQDTGSTEFEDFLDNMFEHAFEDGEEWIEYDEAD